MKQLAAHSPSASLVRYEGPALPTHTARYQVKRKYPGGYVWDVIGSISVDVHSQKDMNRMALLDARLRYRFAGIEVDRVMLIHEEEKKRKALDDLQRFKRKMGMVLRAYAKEQEEIRGLEHGLFVDDELDRLDRQLAEAWAKAEEIYGCTKADFYNTER